jgi:pyruvate ferredoxin oxidoreductase alpha subunit
MIKPHSLKGKIVAKTGNEIAAEAMRQIEPDVVAAYPITPATEIVQIFSQFVADGIVKSKFIAVESEHSAMSATIAASAAGARAMTGTSSQGLCYMWEMLYIASGLRLPIVMVNVNRAISAPINIHCDHSDTMGARDTGWIQIYSENVQEVYDNILQAIKISEQVKLPVIVAMDGFIISHCMELVEIYNDDDVKSFIGEYTPQRYLLDIKKPYTLGALDLQNYYFEHKYQVAQAMLDAKTTIINIANEFNRHFGRQYNLYEKYMMDDADMAIIIIGSAAGIIKMTINKLREQHIKIGLIKIRVYRPFPKDSLATDLAHIKSIAVLDRSDSCSGAFSPVYSDVISSLYSKGITKPKVISCIYGLGGREITVENIKNICITLNKIMLDQDKSKACSIVHYINLRK